MKYLPRLLQHNNIVVWTSRMDKQRPKECLCLYCGTWGNCKYASELFNTCIGGDIALMVTRCRDWTEGADK